MYGMAYGYGAQRGAVAQDTAKVAGQTAGGALTGATVSSQVIAPLLASAGASSAIPVAGWIATIGIGVAAGTIALVMAVKARKMKQREIIAQAQALGVPYAEAVPGYLVKIMDMTQAERKAELQKWAEILAGGRGLKSFGRNMDKVKAKVALVGSVYLVEEGRMGQGPLAKLRGEIAQARSDRQVAQDIGWFAPGSTSRNVAIGASLAAIVAGGFVILTELKER